MPFGIRTRSLTTKEVAKPNETPKDFLAVQPCSNILSRGSVVVLKGQRSFAPFEAPPEVPA